MGDKLARKITAVMATWTFIFAFLFLCVLEIALNHYEIVHFDPSTIILNLCLSLIAAVQGSVIMIAQNQADKDRDAMLRRILEVDDKLLNLEESHERFEQNILASLTSIKEELEQIKAGAKDGENS